ncbi:hypothetical protein JCM6882_000575 [Rhodosporidiobolus microsporus]
MGSLLLHRRSPSELSLAGKRLSQRVLVVLFLFAQPFFLWHLFQPPQATSIISRETQQPFLPSTNPKPVHHLPSFLDFTNHPVSGSRPPSSQFLLNPLSSALRRPSIAIITATKDARVPLFRETAASLSGQSLQNFRWIIVNDGTTKADAIEYLEELESDVRVTVLRNEESVGMAKSRNWALEELLKEGEGAPKYVAMLDDDDMYELTALEKVVSMLESNEEWDLGGFQVVKFGKENELVLSGLHNGASNLVKDNFVPDAAIVTTRSLAQSGCRYPETGFSSGGENHEFWLCIAKAGHWGGTVPEPLYWQRTKPDSLARRNLDSSAALSLYLQQQHSALAASGAFRDIAPRPAQQLEAVRWELPALRSALAPPADGKTLLLVVPTFSDDVVARSAARQAAIFAKKGYRVTVLATLYRPADGLDLRPQFLQWSHDVHVLPAYVRPSDAPAYIKNLIVSRGIKEVLFSQSTMFYELLPVLAEKLPQVNFIDYLHVETDQARPFAVLSAISQRFLSRTVAGTPFLREQLLNATHAPPTSLSVVRPGIDTSLLVGPVPRKTRSYAKRQLLSLSDSTSVILASSSLSTVDRALLVPSIAFALAKRGQRDFLIVVLAGDSPSSADFLSLASSLNVSSHVRLIDTAIEHPESYLAAADVFLRTSTSSEESTMLAEAMSMGIPVVSTSTDGAAEQLGSMRIDRKRGGLLVNAPAGMEDSVAAERFAKEVQKLLRNPGITRMLGQDGRAVAVETMDWRTTQERWVEEVEKVQRGGASSSSRYASRTGELSINPAAHYALQTVLRENHDETDFAVSQRALKAPPRSGVGKELQDRCGETSEDTTKWINSLEAPKSCGGEELDVGTLQKSAKFQCGAWCIFGLTTLDFAGWSYNGNCFEPMTAESWCKAWTSSRPQVNLRKE